MTTLHSPSRATPQLDANSPTMADNFDRVHQEEADNSQDGAIEFLSSLTTDQDIALPPTYLLAALFAQTADQFTSSITIGATLLREFGSIGKVLAAEKPQLRHAFGQDNRPACFIDHLHCKLRATARLMTYALEEEIKERPLIKSWQQLLAYLRLAIGSNSTEHLRILFLDGKNFLIRDEMHQRGTIDHTPIYPREIVKRSLAFNASAIIMVHNHPSGDLKPSPADLEQTKLVMSALDPLGISLHDHLIISARGHFSFKAEHLI